MAGLVRERSRLVFVAIPLVGGLVLFVAIARVSSSSKWLDRRNPLRVGARRDNASLAAGGT